MKNLRRVTNNPISFRHNTQLCKPRRPSQRRKRIKKPMFPFNEAKERSDRKSEETGKEDGGRNGGMGRGWVDGGCKELD